MRKFLIFLCLVMVSGCAARSSRVLVQSNGCPAWRAVHLPLKVALDESAKGYRGPVNKAMNDWNSAMGRQAFVWVYAPGVAADILVTTGPVQDHAEAAARLCHAGRMTHTLTMSPFFDDWAFYRFTQHAFGHALGVGHSTIEASVMRDTLDVDLMSETSGGGEWDSPLPPMYFVTRGDAALANALHP